jgi:hypothetical protein
LRIENLKNFYIQKLEHEATFAVEMNKYLTQASNPNLSQTIIRQLVNTNVLLKEHSDKQMEEKRLLRKKLIQIERTNNEQNKQLEKNEQELRDLRNSNEKLRLENKLKDNEIKNLKSSGQFLHNAQSTPSLNKENILVNTLKSNSSCLIVNDTIEFEENESTSANKSGAEFSHKPAAMSNTNNDSDLKYLDELNKLDFESNQNRIANNTDDDIIIDHNDTPSPLAKKRKNPFVAPVEINFNDDYDQDEIRPNQIQNKLKMQKFKSFNELSLSQRFKESPIEIEIVKPIVTNNLKRSRLNLNESIVNSSGQKAFNYLSDGLGGRAKISNSNATSSNNLINNNNKGIVKKHNFLTKSKVSNFK